MKKNVFFVAAIFAALCLNSCDKNDPDNPIAGGSGKILLTTALPNATGMDGTVYMQLIDEPVLGKTMATNNNNGINVPFGSSYPMIIGQEVYVFPSYHLTMDKNELIKYRRTNGILQREGSLQLPANNSANNLVKLSSTKAYLSLAGTFMRMKEDAMKNGQTKPGYNLQIGTENQFITDFRLFPNPTDTLTLIPFFHSFQHRYNRLPAVGVADSGYGSEENYRFMQENGIEAFVKYNFFHKEQRPRYTPNPFHAESLHYNTEEDYYVCPMGQRMNRIGTRRDKTASGYITESARYKAQNCEGCPLRGSCFKAQGNRIIEVNHRLNQYKRQARERLLSEEGIRHRGRRCIEPEAVFGQMKHNMAYKRFRHVGEDKVTMDFAFFAIAFNIKKMCTKLLKAGKRRSAHTIFIFIRPRVTQNTTNIKPYYLITEKIVA